MILLIGQSDVRAPIVYVRFRCVSWLSALIVVAVGCGGEPLASTDVATSAAPVVGGTPATACQWPTTVSIQGCTATLVHPKLVTLAAHCLTGADVPTEVLFGEDDGRPARRVPVETC